jgi:hypothetical protein
MLLTSDTILKIHILFITKGLYIMEAETVTTISVGAFHGNLPHVANIDN